MNMIQTVLDTLNAKTPPRRVRRQHGSLGSNIVFHDRVLPGTKAPMRPIKTGQPAWFMAMQLAKEAPPVKPPADTSVRSLLFAKNEAAKPRADEYNMTLTKAELQAHMDQRGLPYNTKTTKAQMIDALTGES